MRLFKAAFAALVLILGLSACGGSPQAVAPSAYGLNGQCYYVSSPAEVIYLQNAGLCPRTWVAYPMPAYWHDEYYSYYSSPRYYTHYVPVASRSSWKAQQKAYYAPRKTLIQKAQAAVKKVTSVQKIKNNPAPAPKPKINLVKPAAPRPAVKPKH